MKQLLCTLSLFSLVLAAPARAEQAFGDSPRGSVDVALGASEAVWTKIVEQVVLVPRGLSFSPAYDFGPRPARRALLDGDTVRESVG